MAAAKIHPDATKNIAKYISERTDLAHELLVHIYQAIPEVDTGIVFRLEMGSPKLQSLRNNIMASCV